MATVSAPTSTGIETDNEEDREVQAKAHVEEISTKKFSIGAEERIPLTKDLYHAVTSLSAELYTKDTHFLMELIQNAEDNEYGEGVVPTLEFVLTTRDITGCGAPGTLLVFNNEIGFSRKDLESLCSVGRSTKKGKRDQGFIGEKGIGFKSVFRVSKHPYIVSNGYKVKFSEEPDSGCGIGYIVPQWVDNKSFISGIDSVYSSSNLLPKTTIVLPLKLEKLEAVAKELSQLHPELLLFLFKIKTFSVHWHNNDPKVAKNVLAISVVSETDHMVIKDQKANSCVVHLSAKENLDTAEEKCEYFIWRQKFVAKPESKVMGREDVSEWIISLAFPLGSRLRRGNSSGVFAFLPTSMITNFPFVIQADFLLASSRESILLDNKWNLGILECIPSAFVSSFTSFIKEGCPLFSSIDQAFEFLPVHDSPFQELNKVKDSIRILLAEEDVIPFELFSGNMHFCKPTLAVRILPRFRELLFHMKGRGTSMHQISSLSRYAIHSSLDQAKYGAVLDFLGVSSNESCSWYGDCNLS